MDIIPETPVQRLRVCNKAGRLRFKTGDKVRCVDALNLYGYELRAGAVYLAEAVDADNRVKLSCYPSVWFGGDRFVLAEEQPIKLMLVGPSRCGKDEAGQFLESITGLRFAGTTSKYLSPYVARCLGMNEEECYAKRHEMREAWYHVGRAVRSGDPGILVRESLKHGEIIGGVRDREEVIAAREMVSLIVWIENERPEKDPTLMFGPECCDIIIPNNGTLEEYHERLRRFAAALGIAKASK